MEASTSQLVVVLVEDSHGPVESSHAVVAVLHTDGTDPIGEGGARFLLWLVDDGHVLEGEDVLEGDVVLSDELGQDDSQELSIDDKVERLWGRKVQQMIHDLREAVPGESSGDSDGGRRDFELLELCYKLYTNLFQRSIVSRSFFAETTRCT